MASSEGEGASQGPNLVIWGTDVVVSRCKEKFKRFINNFTDMETDKDEQPENMESLEPLYVQKLEEVWCRVRGDKFTPSGVKISRLRVAFSLGIYI